MDKPILSRYLYIYDEVILQFMTTLLKKENLEECYYWFSELYYSKFDDIQELFYYIYFDFYFINNPNYLEFVNNKIHKNTYLSYLHLIQNLFKLDVSLYVFLSRQYATINININKKFKGKTPEWVKIYPEETQLFIRLLKKKDYKNMILELKKIDYKTHLYILTLFYKKNENIITKLSKQFKKIKYNNELHIILSLILLFEFNNDINLDINKIKMVKISKKKYNQLLDFNRDTDEIKPYNLLNIKKQYQINDIITAFHLTQENIEHSIDLNENWIHFTYNCKLWNRRIINYQGNYQYNNNNDNNNDNQNLKNIENIVIFKNEEDEEEFYNRYNYEIDEKPLPLKIKHYHEMTKYNWKDWISFINIDLDTYLNIQSFPNDFNNTKFIY